MFVLRAGTILLLLTSVLVPSARSEEADACPYEKGRRVEGLEAILINHTEWLKKRDLTNPDIPGRANLCNAHLPSLNLGQANLFAANLKGAAMLWANLKGANLRFAELGGASLHFANLRGTDFRFANLEGAALVLARLEGADFSDADLQRANLSKAKLEGADFSNANLEGASLISANLQGATLESTILTNTQLRGSDLSRALYQPETAPAQGHLSGIVGLPSVVFCPGRDSGLVQLRAALKGAGLRDLERQATFALEAVRTRHALTSWYQDGIGKAVSHHCRLLPEWKPTDALEGFFRLIFFEWVTDYGWHYGRPVWLLISLTGVFALIYLFAVVWSAKRPDSHSGIYRVWPKGRIQDTYGRLELAKDEFVEPLKATGQRAIGVALYFSVISAFHLGWRELNVGTWIARMQPREYGLRAKGWVRFVSGIQSLISVYLIAMWALTYFGRPFE